LNRTVVLCASVETEFGVNVSFIALKLLSLVTVVDSWR
jgi:hypothetical protein